MRGIREYVIITIGALIVTFVPLTNSWADGDWEFRFVPFLWATSLTGELGPSARPATVNMDFSDLLDMTEAGFTGQIDATYKENWWFAVEGQYLELEKSGTGPGGARVKAETTFGIASFVVGKPLIENVDVYTGGRYLHMDTDVSITGVGTIGKKEEWVDPIIGFRIRADATEKLFIRFGMDIGGFGVNSDLHVQRSVFSHLRIPHVGHRIRQRRILVRRKNGWPAPWLGHNILITIHNFCVRNRCAKACVIPGNDCSRANDNYFFRQEPTEKRRKDMKRSGKLTWRTKLFFFVVAGLLSVSLSGVAHADWSFGIGTGIFRVNFDGDIGYNIEYNNIGPVEHDVDLDADDVSDVMETAFGLGGYATDGKWMIQYSFGMLELEDDASVVLSSGDSVYSKIGFDKTNAELTVGYPIYHDARYTDHEIDRDLTINGTRVASRDIDEDWTDALFGISADIPFAEKWMWNNKFNAGFGGSEGTYFAQTGVTWRFLKHWSASLYGKYTAVFPLVNTLRHN
jgi:hypothetical protein